MQIRELLQGVKNASLVCAADLELLLGHVLQVPRSYFYSHPEAIVSDEDNVVFTELLRRREDGEPLAYLLGKSDFWSLTLTLNNAVLIPRPETERLIEIVQQHLDRRKVLTIAELGTGSGALALAIANDCPRWHVCATDICPLALQVAVHNAKNLRITNVSFHQGDWCAALERQENFYSPSCFVGEGQSDDFCVAQHRSPNYRLAAIISNPPYVAVNDPHLQDTVRRYEPSQALFAGDDGLDAIRVIVKQAPDKLENGGWLMLEHGFNHGASVRSLLHEQEFQKVATYKDFSGHDRVTIGQKE